MKDGELAEAYRRGITQRAPVECPSEATLVALAEGQLEAARRVEVVNHVAGCAACHDAFQLLDTVGVAAGRLRGTRRRRWAYGVGAVAAAAALTLLVAPALRDNGVPVMRGVDSVLVLVTPREVVAAGPIVFAWRRIPDAVRYEVRVLGADGSPVATESSPDTTVTMAGPWTDRTAIYRWRVEAIRLDGTRIGSPFEAFEVRP